MALKHSLYGLEEVQMANKTYTVVKDGEELKELKSLAAAKKLADTEGAEVFCDSKCVYQGTVAPVEDTVSAAEETVEVETVEEEKAETTTMKEDSVKDEPFWKPDGYDLTRTMARMKKRPVQFVLLRKMNVRKEPSLSAEILRVLRHGTDIMIKDIQNDWLCLANGGFILFENGKNAFPTR